MDVCIPAQARLVAHKTHSSKSTNGFRYEMHETDRQTYCAALPKPAHSHAHATKRPLHGSKSILLFIFVIAGFALNFC